MKNLLILITIMLVGVGCGEGKEKVDAIPKFEPKTGAKKIELWDTNAIPRGRFIKGRNNNLDLPTPTVYPLVISFEEDINATDPKEKKED